MKSIKLIIIFLITLIFLISLKIKIDLNQDLIWHIKQNLHPKIVFNLKKIYIYYSHELRRTIVLKKMNNETLYASNIQKYKLTRFSNKTFKKNGPKVFIETFSNNIFAITGTGILSFAKLEDFKKEKFNLRIVRNNLREILGTNNIVENPAIILNMEIFKEQIYISYVNQKKKNCFNTSVVKGTINLKKIHFIKIFSPNTCVDKNNSYGEFQILEAGGALEAIDEDRLILSTGTFRFRDLTQKEDNIFGKILLIDLKNNLQKVISMGHRNVQGMFFDKKKNILFSTDHGPQGGDEINLIFNPFDNKIKNFGWPISSYGEHYGGRIDKNKQKYQKAPLFKSHSDYGFIEPHKYFVSSIAPSNIINVPKIFGSKSGNEIYVSSLGFNNDKGRRSIHTFSLNNNNQLTNHEIIPVHDRVRDIEFIQKFNSIFLFLEKSGSIGILENYSQ